MQTNNSQGYDYSLYQLLQFIVSKYRLVLGVPLIVTVVTALWTLSISDTYVSDTILSPTEEAQGGGLNSAMANQLGGLASLAGLSIGGESTDNVTVALAILKSRKFISQFVEKYGLKPQLMAVDHWERETNKLHIDESIYASESGQWLREPTSGRPPEPTDLEVYETFSDMLVVTRDQATGLITISLEYFSPFLAQEWLELLVAEINQEMRARERKSTRENISYLESQVEIIDNIEMRSVFYQLIQEQMKSLMLAEVRSNFVFTTIDPPVVAEIKYAPKRAMICLIASFLSGFLIVAFYTVVFLITPREK